MGRGARRTGTIAVVAAVGLLTLAAAGWLRAADPPHWASFALNIDCTSQCHTTHSILQGATANVNLCQSCHAGGGLAADLPMATADSAVPGVGGTSHAFNVIAVNAGLDTQEPLDVPMQRRIMENRVVCSTCHAQHASTNAFGGEVRVSPPKMVAGTFDVGDGTLSSGGTFAGTAGVWYVVKVTVAGTQATAQFQWQKYNEVGGWTAWSADTPAGAPVVLDDGITVSFGAGNYALDDVWELSVAWPFLRASVAASTMCRDCHRSWDMDHASVETWTGGYKSHPVGVGLDANGRGYDRGAPLDGDGGAAGTDGNPSNDLELDGGNVQCLTCHGVHYVDSNTLTVDGP